MKKRNPKLVAARMEDLIERDSIRRAMAFVPESVAAAVHAAIGRMIGCQSVLDYGQNGKPMNQSEILRHNAAMTEQLAIIRFHTRGRQCFKCGRLFVPDGPHRGCEDCYLEWIASQPNRPDYYEFDEADWPDPECREDEDTHGDRGMDGEAATAERLSHNAVGDAPAAQLLVVGAS
jgi:hypothetical protein